MRFSSRPQLLLLVLAKTLNFDFSKLLNFKNRFSIFASILMENVRFLQICLEEFYQFWWFGPSGLIMLQTTFTYNSQLKPPKTYFSHYKRAAATITITPIFDRFALVPSGFDTFTKIRFSIFASILMENIRFLQICLEEFYQFWWFGPSGLIMLQTTFTYNSQLKLPKTYFSHYKRAAATITITPIFDRFALVPSGFDTFTKIRFWGFASIPLWTPCWSGLAGLATWPIPLWIPCRPGPHGQFRSGLLAGLDPLLGWPPGQFHSGPLAGLDLLRATVTWPIPLWTPCWPGPLAGLSSCQFAQICSFYMKRPWNCWSALLLIHLAADPFIDVLLACGCISAGSI